MNKIRVILKRSVVGIMIALQVFFYPVAAVAQSSSDEPAADPVDSTTQSTESTPEQTPPEEQSTEAPAITTGPTLPTGPQDPTGPTLPTGPSSSTYTYNEETGLWENDYYTWDPVTHQTKPKTPQTYSYNPQTHMWDTTEYYYSPEQGKYLPNVKSVAKNPNAKGSSGFGSINGTGPGSNNTIDFGGSSSSSFDLFFDATISNKIGQMSKSGDATVDSNLQAGNALSGDAQTLTNILNMLQSSWGDLGNNVATFSVDINGDIVGDLFIDPSQIPVSTASNNIDINVSENALIQNDIDVSAQSGDAKVTNNTTAGNATTGNAKALVNLINLINSAIHANKSFLGVLNINGNLDGDILLPPELLQAIIASTGANSTNAINASTSSNVDVDVTTNRTINNNIVTDASTGDATVSNNTNAGSATSGNAQNNILLLNLTGQHVVAKNSLIVFVNVLGSWVGMIMNAPTGTYAVATTGPGSTNTINANNDRNVDVDITENSRIDNNVRASAQSGDALVDSNTNAGNAKSGDAEVSVNVLNMIDSSFELSDWFGVLFINVFGSWNGSFGVNTAAGNRPTGGLGGGQTAGAATDATAASRTGQVFGFIPKSNKTASNQTSNANNAAGQTSSTSTDNKAPQTSAVAAAKKNVNPLIPILSIVIAVVLLGGEKMWALLKRN